MNEEKNTKNSRRADMLGLVRREFSSLVLYDTLRKKDFTSFCRLLKTGYALDAFILNYIIDSGFEAKLLTALNLCQRYCLDVYDFLCLYLGKENAEQYFVRGFISNARWKPLIQNKFNDESLKKYELWNIALEQRKYKLLADSGKMIFVLEDYDRNPVPVIDFLKKYDYAQELYSLGELKSLRYSSQGCKLLWCKKIWKEVLSMENWQVLEASGLDNMTDVFQHIFAQGGTDDLFNCRKIEAKQFLLSLNFYQPFIDAKCWGILYDHGLYHLIDVEHWWRVSSSPSKARSHVIRCAVEQKNWYFLEEKGCLKALFWHFCWLRWYRSLVSCNA